MQYTINIHEDRFLKKAVVDEGSNLLKVLRNNGVIIDTPCGGKGTCGKCSVKLSGVKDAPTEKEKTLLGSDKLEKGYRLACYISVNSDMDVYPERDMNKDAAIVTGGKKRDIEPAPIINKQYVEMPLPELENQLSDVERLIRASGRELAVNNLPLLQKIPELLRGNGFKATLICQEDKLIGIEPGNTVQTLYGTAFDIGTTTVAAYLYNLNNGKCLAVSSMINPQREFGADVISRISYTMQAENNTEHLQQIISECINELTKQLVRKAGIGKEDIYAAVFTGNTTMLHFLMGLETANIAVSPFIPVTTKLQIFNSDTLGLDMNKEGIGVAFPGVSAYIGGDTVAAVMSSGMYEKDEMALLVDIGTNGEIVLGDSESLLACSTAAGPAFEGANIRNGVGGVKGAIDTVGPGPAFQYTTIGNESPAGICGSGLIDMIARLLDAGVIDETGRLADDDEAEELEEAVRNRLVTIDGMRMFVIAAEGERGSASQIVVTQKDIRELQNAKAAIAAGIDMLVKLSGKGYDSIGKVYLAGGFGSNINIESALKIGLLPRSTENRVEAVGNASGAGAAEGLLSKDMLKLAESIKQRIKYIELSAIADFAEKYVDNMFF